MGIDLEKRLATDRDLLVDVEHRRQDDYRARQRRVQIERLLQALEAERAGIDRVGVPGKATVREQGELSKRRDRAPASRSERARAGLPWPSRTWLDDYRAVALGEVIARLEDRRLREATLAAADAEIARRVGTDRAIGRGEESAASQPLSSPGGRALWRAAERHAAMLYRHAQEAGEVASEDPVVEEALARRGSGQPLPAALRAQMERALGISLARVRVHTDGVAAAAAKAVRASAFTVREDIFFAQGAYAPDTARGKKLIAHELVHVVQAYQGRTATSRGGLRVSAPGEALEREADALAERIAASSERAGALGDDGQWSRTPASVEVGASAAALATSAGSSGTPSLSGGGASLLLRQQAGATSSSGSGTGSGEQRRREGEGEAATVTRESFDVQHWTARHNTAGGSGRPTGPHATTHVLVQSGGIRASANVRALTPEAQRYSVGFVQTLHSSTRRAIYESGPGVVVDTWVATRGEMLDQRTDIRSPVPWYNYGVPLGSEARRPAMTDNPTAELPQWSPSGGLLARMEGTERFTTYLVAMVGNDASTIIYLGNVHWSINWAGRFDSALVYSGHNAFIGDAELSGEGNAVLGGPAANEGPSGDFERAPSATSSTSATTATTAASSTGGASHGAPDAGYAALDAAPASAPSQRSRTPDRSRAQNDNAATPRSQSVSAAAQPAQDAASSDREEAAQPAAGSGASGAAKPAPDGKGAKQADQASGPQAKAGEQEAKGGKAVSRSRDKGQARPEPAAASEGMPAVAGKNAPAPSTPTARAVQPPQPVSIPPIAVVPDVSLDAPKYSRSLSEQWVKETGRTVEQHHQQIVQELASFTADAQAKLAELQSLADAEITKVTADLGARVTALESTHIVPGGARVEAAYGALANSFEKAEQKALADIAKHKQAGTAQIANAKAKNSAALEQKLAAARGVVKATVDKNAPIAAQAIKTWAVGIPTWVSAAKQAAKEAVKPVAESYKPEKGDASSLASATVSLEEDVKKHHTLEHGKKLGKQYEASLLAWSKNTDQKASELVNKALEPSRVEFEMALDVAKKSSTKAIDDAFERATAQLDAAETTAKQAVADAKKNGTARFESEKKAAGDAADQAGKELSDNAHAAGKELADQIKKKAAADSKVYAALVSDLHKQLEKPTPQRLEQVQPRIAAAREQLAKLHESQLADLRTLVTQGTSSLGQTLAKQQDVYSRAIRDREDSARTTEKQVLADIAKGAETMGGSLRALGDLFDRVTTQEAAKVDAAIAAFNENADKATLGLSAKVTEHLQAEQKQLDANLQENLQDAKIRADVEPGVAQEVAAKQKALGKDAAALRDAMDGWGTNENKIYATLRKCSWGEITYLEAVYDDHYNWRGAGGRTPLRADLHDELSGDELRIALAYLDHDRTTAIKLELADSTGFWNDDEARIEEVLRSCSEEEITYLNTNPEAQKVVEDVKGALGGCDLDVMTTLLDQSMDREDRKAKADAIRLFDAMAGWGTDEAKMKEILEGAQTEEERQRLRAAFNQYATAKGWSGGDGGAKGEQDDALARAIEDDTSGGERALMLTLAKTDRNEEDVKIAKLYEGADGVGTNETQIFDALDDADYAKAWQEATPEQRKVLEEERRKRLDQKLDKMSGGESATVQGLIDSEMEKAAVTYQEFIDGKKADGRPLTSWEIAQVRSRDPGINRLEWMVAQRKLQTGQAEPELMLAYACWGVVGTDEETIQKVLSNGGEPKSIAEIQAIRAAFHARWGVPLTSHHELLEMNKGEPTGVLADELSGKDWNKTRQLLCGKPETAEQLKYLGDLRAKYATSGLLGGTLMAVGEAVGFTEAKSTAEHQQARFDEYYAKHFANNPTASLDSAEGERLVQLGEYLEQDYEAYSAALNSLVDGVVTALEVIGGVIITVVTAGTAAPVLSAVIANLVLSAGTITFKYAALGEQYGAAELANDVVKAIGTAAFAGLGEVKALGKLTDQAGAAVAQRANKLLQLGDQALARTGLRAGEKGLEMGPKAVERLSKIVAAGTKNVILGAGQEVYSTLTDEKTYEKKLGEAVWGEDSLGARLLKGVPRSFAEGAVSTWVNEVAGTSNKDMAGRATGPKMNALTNAMAEMAGATSGFFVYVDNYQDAEQFWIQLLKTNANKAISGALNGYAMHKTRAKKLGRDFINGDMLPEGIAEMLAHMDDREKKDLAEFVKKYGGDKVHELPDGFKQYLNPSDTTSTSSTAGKDSEDQQAKSGKDGEQQQETKSGQDGEQQQETKSGKDDEQEQQAKTGQDGEQEQETKSGKGGEQQQETKSGKDGEQQQAKSGKDDEQQAKTGKDDEQQQAKSGKDSEQQQETKSGKDDEQRQTKAGKDDEQSKTSKAAAPQEPELDAPKTPQQLAAEAQRLANQERIARLADKQAQFAEIDKLALLARTPEDWAFIRKLEHEVGRPVSERYSPNDELAALQAMAKDANLGVHHDGTPVTPEEHAASVAAVKAELEPELAKQKAAHQQAVQALTDEVNQSIAARDRVVMAKIVEQVQAAPKDEHGRAVITIEQAVSLGMGGAGATAAKVGKEGNLDEHGVRTDRIGIEDATKPELWGTLGHKAMGQEAAAISYGTDGIRTSDVAEHATAQFASAAELALQVAAQRDASGVGTIKSHGPAGPLEFQVVTRADGTQVLEVGIPIKIALDPERPHELTTVVVKTQQGVDLSTGLGPARKLAEKDSPDGSRKAQITPEDAKTLADKITSGEEALARPAESFKGERVLGIGGGPTSEWAMEHALGGGAKSVEVAGQMPRPPRDSDLHAPLEHVEGQIRALVEQGKPVPKELTDKHHAIIATHVRRERERLAQLEAELAKPDLSPREREKLTQERDRVRAGIDPFLGSRVDRNFDTLNNDKITHVQADVIKVRPIEETLPDGTKRPAIEVVYADGTSRIVDRVIPSIGADPEGPGGIHQLVKGLPKDTKLIPVIAEGRVVGLESDPPGLTVSGAVLTGTLGTNMPAELLQRIPAPMRDAVIASFIDHASRPGVSAGSKGIVPGIENVGANPELVQKILALPPEERQAALEELLHKYKLERAARFGGERRFDDRTLRLGEPRTEEERLLRLEDLARKMRTGSDAEKAKAKADFEALAAKPEWRAAIEKHKLGEGLFDTAKANDPKKPANLDDTALLSEHLATVLRSQDRARLGADPVLQAKRERFEREVALAILQDGPIRRQIDAELARLCEKAFDYIMKTRSGSEAEKAIGKLGAEKKTGYGGAVGQDPEVMLEVLANGNIRERMLALQNFAALMAQDALDPQRRPWLEAMAQSGALEGERSFDVDDANRLRDRVLAYERQLKKEQGKQGKKPNAKDVLKPVGNEAEAQGPHKDFAEAKKQNMDTKLPRLFADEVAAFLGREVVSDGPLVEGGEDSPLARSTMTVREAIAQGLELSEREIAAAGGLDAPLNWVIGQRANLVDPNAPFIADARLRSLPLKAGISGTTFRWMLAVELLGGDPRLGRLAAIASLQAVDAHSYHEIASAARGFGLAYDPERPYDHLGIDRQELESLARSIGTTLDELNGVEPAH